MHRFVFALAVAAAILLPATMSPASAQDQAALSGLKEVKVAYDVTNGDAKALLTVLDVIDEARQSLIKQGVKPDFVIAFRGPATRLVQTDESKIKPEEREHTAKIAERIKAFGKADGVARSSSAASWFGWPAPNRRTWFRGSRWSATAGSR